MRLLIVAIPDSIHVARWLAQIADQGWDIHLFPSFDRGQIHPQMSNLTVHHSLYYTDSRHAQPPNQIRTNGFNVRMPVFRQKAGAQVLLSTGTEFLRSTYQRMRPFYRADQLQKVIEQVKPDIVHSMEFQAGAYLAMQVKERLGDAFPPWIITNYGSDIYLFGRLNEHRARVEAILRAADYYTAECQRDVELALSMGFRGEVLGVGPNGGGFRIEQYQQFRQPGPSSARKLILIKGYQHWAGRALVALRALALCGAEVLKGYEIVVHSPSSVDVLYSSELLSQELGMPVTLLPPIAHEELLRYYGRARIHVGLSISDAASTSMLEAITMGALPIQSSTACVDEWIEDGENGLIVPPEDPDIVAQAIRRGLQDDALVDRAAEINVRVAAEKLEYTYVQQRVIGWYEKVYGQPKPARP